MRPDDVLDALRADITRIRDDSAWAFHNGWWPKGADPDRVVGDAQDVIGRDEDDEEKEIPEHIKRDIGVGCRRSRQAFQDTAYLVTFLEMQLVVALRWLGEDVQPPFSTISRRSTLEDRFQALSMAEWRLMMIAELWDEAPRPWQSKARKALSDHRGPVPSARSAADRAVRLLAEAFSQGSTDGIATAEKYCSNCGMQPVGERTGPRCPACSQYKWRSGMERPPKLYLADNAEAFAAAARRRARGDGFGAA